MRWLINALRAWWPRPARDPLGKRAENLAAEYLQKQGMKILKRSYRLTIGELDLVALDGETLVFVEVRSRVGRTQGEPWETIRQKKQRKLSALAVAFLKSNRSFEHRASRFDVLSVVWNADGTSAEIEHFRDAFPLRGPWQA